MNKGFKFNSGSRPDFGDLLQAEFARQDDPLDADIFEKGHSFRCVTVHLGAGKQWDWGQVTFEQTKILNDQGIHPGLIQTVT